MITMKVADENVIDFLEMNMHFPKGNLCTFTTIEQEEVLIVIHQLCRWVTFRSRYCGTASEYGNIKLEHGTELEQ